MAKRGYPYSACRARIPGHDWSRIDTRKGNFGFYTVDICSVCTTTFTRVLNHRGQRIAQWYRYPADYKDPRALTIADYRAEVLSKMRLSRLDSTVAELLMRRSEAIREALEA